MAKARSVEKPKGDSTPARAFLLRSHQQFLVHVCRFREGGREERGTFSQQYLSIIPYSFHLASFFCVAVFILSFALCFRINSAPVAYAKKGTFILSSWRRAACVRPHNYPNARGEGERVTATNQRRRGDCCGRNLVIMPSESLPTAGGKKKGARRERESFCRRGNIRERASTTHVCVKDLAARKQNKT